jgi:predicted phosphodiesterase
MRVAVLSDIHSNLVALDTVLASIGTVDAIWHLGDIVGYGPEPVAAIGRLREVGAIGVRGNHDDAAAGGSTIDSFNPDGYAAMLWTRDRIGDPERAYLAALPETLVPAGTDFTLAHGSPRDPIWEYLVSQEAAEENLAAFATPWCLVGHSHLPLVFRQYRGHMGSALVESGSQLALDDGRLILNPGSVGQPRDGNPEASYLILDTSAGRVTWHRIAYDIAATQAAMLAAGLPPSLARRLSFGL